MKVRLICLQSCNGVQNIGTVQDGKAEAVPFKFPS
nr:MAG TPA: hypothetical protein [Caudoviricetes sp.]